MEGATEEAHQPFLGFDLFRCIQPEKSQEEPGERLHPVGGFISAELQADPSDDLNEPFVTRCTRGPSYLFAEELQIVVNVNASHFTLSTLQ
jgi:hypothetical protein